MNLHPKRFVVPRQGKPQHTATGARIPDEILPPESQGNVDVRRVHEYCMRDVEISLYVSFTIIEEHHFDPQTLTCSVCGMTKSRFHNEFEPSCTPSSRTNKKRLPE